MLLSPLDTLVHDRSFVRFTPYKMGYIPPHALHNLSKYKYQGIDKWVHPMTSLSHLDLVLTERVVVATQIYIIKLRAEPVLELASGAMADLGRSEHCKRRGLVAVMPPSSPFSQLIDPSW